MSDSLPKIGRALGKVFGEFLSAMREAEKPIEEAAKTITETLGEPPLLVFVSSVMDPKREDLTTERATAKKAIEGFPPLTRAWRFEESCVISEC